MSKLKELRAIKRGATVNWSECEQLLRMIGANVRRIRVQKGWTQQDLATQTRCLARTSITNIERGKQKMTVLTLAAVSRALDVPPGELMEVVPDTRVEIEVGGRKLLVPTSALEKFGEVPE